MTRKRWPLVSLIALGLGAVAFAVLTTTVWAYSPYQQVFAVRAGTTFEDCTCRYPAYDYSPGDGFTVAPIIITNQQGYAADEWFQCEESGFIRVENDRGSEVFVSADAMMPYSNKGFDFEGEFMWFWPPSWPCWS